MVTKKLFNSREEWLQGRKNHIGGSDAAACVGLNPYKDNVQLWEEKVGLVLPEDISDKDYVQYGTEAEEHLRALFALDHPEYKVFYDPDNMFTNSKYPWMHASLDGELLDTAAAGAWGLPVSGCTASEAQRIVDALSEGKLVVAIMSKGHFTSGGHFIVLRGVKDGKIMVADPASYSRSEQLWDLSIIVNEASRRAGAGGPFWIIG